MSHRDREVDELFAAHRPRVLAYCRRIVPDRQRADDLAQESLLVAWRRLDEFRGEAPFERWLFTIARFTCYNALRRHGDALTEDGLLDPSDPEGGVLQALQQEERAQLLREAAAAVLDPLEQEAVHLRYVENLGQDAITHILRIEERTGARGVLQRCRRKLERELRARLAAIGRGSSFVRSGG